MTKKDEFDMFAEDGGPPEEGHDCSKVRTTAYVPDDPVLYSRYRGCLLGGAVGDALGSAVEFMSDDAIRRKFGEEGIRDYINVYGRKGAITDDTQMMMFTADGMLRSYLQCYQRGIGPNFSSITAHAYLRWLLTQGHRSELLDDADWGQGWLISNRELFSRRAPGNTCLSALKSMKAGAGLVSNRSKGCGGVMRVAPVGLFTAHWMNASQDYDNGFGDPFKTGSAVAKLTHGHPSGYLAAGAFAFIIALLLKDCSLPDAIDQAKTELCRHDGHEEVLAAIEQAQACGRDPMFHLSSLVSLGEGWVAEEALAISLYCALTAPDFESGIVNAVNHGGDSDSTGSMTGNLLGIMNGLQAIPKRWLVDLELREAIETLADDLATAHRWELDLDNTMPDEVFYGVRYPPI